MKTWWVEFEWTCDIEDTTTGEWFEERDCDACRLQCLKKNIPEVVRNHIAYELRCEKYKNLKINIIDVYETTEYEI